jgi:hypothetical protein
MQVKARMFSPSFSAAFKNGGSSWSAIKSDPRKLGLTSKTATLAARVSPVGQAEQAVS